MIRDLVSNLDYSICAEIALSVFVASFALIVFGTFRLSKPSTDRFANIPLRDELQD